MGVVLGGVPYRIFAMHRSPWRSSRWAGGCGTHPTSSNARWTIVTRYDLDHTKCCGNTVAEIAAEKS